LFAEAVAEVLVPCAQGGDVVVAVVLGAVQHETAGARELVVDAVQ